MAVSCISHRGHRCADYAMTRLGVAGGTRLARCACQMLAPRET